MKGTMTSKIDGKKITSISREAAISKALTTSSIANIKSKNLNMAISFYGLY